MCFSPSNHTYLFTQTSRESECGFVPKTASHRRWFSACDIALLYLGLVGMNKKEVMIFFVYLIIYLPPLRQVAVQLFNLALKQRFVFSSFSIRPPVVWQPAMTNHRRPFLYFISFFGLHVRDSSLKLRPVQFRHSLHRGAAANCISR